MDDFTYESIRLPRMSEISLEGLKSAGKLLVPARRYLHGALMTRFIKPAEFSRRYNMIEEQLVKINMEMFNRDPSSRLHNFDIDPNRARVHTQLTKGQLTEF